MRKQFAVLSMLAATTLAGCSDLPTGAEPTLAPSATPEAARGGRHRATLAVPVEGVVEGGTFVGTATITKLALDASGNLVASGVVSGTTTVGSVVTAITGQAFTTSALITEASGDVVGGISTQALISPNDPGACDLLFLDLGPISLDLLGLSLDLSQVLLDLDAIPGGGNLLGNLLCTVVHLLDGPGAILAALENLLDLINAIIDALP